MSGPERRGSPSQLSRSSTLDILWTHFPVFQFQLTSDALCCVFCIWDLARIQLSNDGDQRYFEFSSLIPPLPS